MPTLGLVMIVRNEAHCLGACLEAARAIVDRMVIVDTGSTDSTPGIAKGYGARVDDFAWSDDFAAARNHALALADADWILHLDADEELDPHAAGRIRALVDADGEGHDAVEVTLANYCDDPRAWRWVPVPPHDPYARGRAGYIAVGLLRLFRNGRGYEYRERVHENITASVIERGGRILRAPDIVIHHHGYDGDPARRAEKARRYLGIARAKAEERPGDAKAQHDLAEQALACGLAEEAEAAARRAVAIEPDHLAANTTLANLLLNRGALDEARAVLEGLEARDAAAPHVGAALGAIDLRQGRYARGRARLEAVLAAAPRAPIARACLARALDLLGEPDHALRELELLRDMFPGLPEFDGLLRAHRLRRQAAQLLRAGFAPQALEALVEALRLDPEDPLIHNDLGVTLHHLGETARARQSLERAAALAPGLPMIEDNLRQLA